MTDPRKRLRVAAGVIRRRGRILLARRRAGGHLAGYWELPGGKVEGGETPEECLARELAEEFGVAAEIGRFLGSNRHDYETTGIELLAYEVVLAPGPWTLASHDEVRWVELRDLLTYRLAPADIPIAEKLAAGSGLPQPGPTARKRS